MTTIPPPSTHAPDTPRYIMIVKEYGAMPLRYEWDRLEINAASRVHPATPCIMDSTIAAKFDVMERHKWTKASGEKIELEIVK